MLYTAKISWISFTSAVSQMSFLKEKDWVSVFLEIKCRSFLLVMT